MKRQNFLSILGSACLVPTVFVGNSFVLQEKKTIFSILREAFGEEDKKLFKRICLILPESLKNLEVSEQTLVDIPDNKRYRSSYQILCITGIISLTNPDYGQLSRNIYFYLMSKREKKHYTDYRGDIDMNRAKLVEVVDNMYYELKH